MPLGKPLFNVKFIHSTFTQHSLNNKQLYIWAGTMNVSLKVSSTWDFWTHSALSFKYSTNLFAF